MENRFLRAHIGAGASCLSCPLSLLVHGLFKELFIKADVLVGKHFLHKVDREAVGIVKLKSLFAVQNCLFLGIKLIYIII